MDDDERNIKEQNEDNTKHRVKGRDEAKRKSDNRSKKKANKDINLTGINARNAYDQDRIDENNNDHLGHGSQQKGLYTRKL